MKQLSDLTDPYNLQPKAPLEADIQAKCVDWARKRGYWARKFSSIAQRSVPDYLFRGRGICFAVEFKRPGKVSTEAQLGEQKAMREVGWVVIECNDVEIFKSIVLSMEKGEWR